MNEKLRGPLGWTIIIALLSVSFGVVKYVEVYSKSIEPSTFRSFSVSGEGKVVAVPDVARFTFSVITEGGKDLSALQESNVSKTNSAIDFVKSKGVDSKDIKTEGYSVEPRYQYANCSSNGPTACPPPAIVGYIVRQTVMVSVRDFTKAGEILGGVVSQGANQVSQLAFTIDDPTSVENVAREEAIAKAREKAEAVADAGGFRVGRLLSIDEGGYYPSPYYDKAMGMGGDEMVRSSIIPIVEPGSQEVKITVTLRYEID